MLEIFLLSYIPDTRVINKKVMMNKKSINGGDVSIIDLPKKKFVCDFHAMINFSYPISMLGV